MNVLDIFYKNIISEASTGRIDCNFYYNVAFSTKVEDLNLECKATVDNENLLIPTLIIRNKEMFDILLMEYVDLAMKFYDDSNFDSDILDYKMYNENKRICKEKVILALLFANATAEDFINPCEFLRKRINFFKNDITCCHNLGYCEMLKGEVILKIEKDIINNETPHQLIIKVISEKGEEFSFPRIKLGISDNDVYIYAIQNKNNENNSFCKKINRILYKIGEGYSEEYENDGENLKDVTSSFLVALNISISYLYNMGYCNVTVPSCLIERWNAKSIANTLKIKYRKIDDDGIKEILNNQEMLQQNLTNKLVRTFLRLGCHYNNIDILSFPYEVDSSLHLSINDNYLQCNNSLLLETYMLVQNGISRKYRK